MEQTEIKFRGLLQTKGEKPRWVYYTTKNAHDILFDDGSWDIIRVKDSQYTGLKDKDGKDIYKGDILRCYHDEDSKSIFAIKDFIDDVWLMLQEIEHVQMQWEILGNIYENPELLKPNK